MASPATVTAAVVRRWRRAMGAALAMLWLALLGPGMGAGPGCAAQAVAAASNTTRSPFTDLVGPNLYVWGEMQDEKAQGGTAIYEVDTDSMLGEVQYLLLYFSASWCGPCQQFTPRLAKFYQAALKAKQPMEVVWVSADRSQEQFVQYYSKMPWFAVPWPSAQERFQELSATYGVQGIPFLVLLDSRGRVVTSDGVAKVLSDPSALQFPWLGPARTLQRRLTSLVPHFARRAVHSLVDRVRSAVTAQARSLRQAAANFVRGALQGVLPAPLLRLIVR